MKNKILFYISSFIFISMISFGIYKLVTTINEYKTAENTYTELEQYINTNYKETTIIIEDTNNKEEINNNYPKVDFKSLKEINPNIVAWIYFEDLNINYPIAQGKDNDYYLNHMIDNTSNKAGSIFLDYRNNSNISDKHTIIYGHNMKDGTMFANLTKYTNQDFYNNHPSYILITPNNNYKVEIISGYLTNTNTDAWKLEFSSTKDFEKWLNNTKEKSLFQSNINPTINDNIITLSTCSNTSDDERFILVGILTNN